MDDLEPVLGAPVEPPADVWADALSGALEESRHPAELALLIPSVAGAGQEVADPSEQEGVDEDGPDAADPWLTAADDEHIEADADWSTADWPAGFSGQPVDGTLEDPGSGS